MTNKFGTIPILLNSANMRNSNTFIFSYINDLRAAITDKHKAVNPFIYHSVEKAN